MSDDPHTIDSVVVKAETEKALLVFIEEIDQEHWIPKSVILAESDVYKKDQKGDITVKMWWAEKNDMIW